MKRLTLSLIIITSALLSQNLAFSIASNYDSTHAYYHELLETSLIENGHSVTMRKIPPMPPKRSQVSFEMERIDVVWLLESKERNAKFTPVDVGLTNGLIGSRVLFIPKGAQKKYDSIQTLEEFRKSGLRGALGITWYDVAVWEKNDLPHMKKDGNWHQIYKWLKDGIGNFDYFARGINEIAEEAPLHPYLDVEKNLMLVYERDFVFYLNTGSAYLKPHFEKALLKAKDSGLRERLIKKHWLTVFEKYGYESRRKIQLVTP